MTCDSVLKLIPLYFYGELDPAEEERVEEHFHACPSCAREMERQRKLAAALERRRAEVSPLLLDDCRAGLMAAIHGGPAQAAQAAPASKGPWILFLEAMGATFGSAKWRVHSVWQPVGALALLLVGFFAGRLATNSAPQSLATAGLGGDVFATVRSVHPESSGRVQVAFDETRRRVVSGRLDDQTIQKLLLAAAHEQDPAVRVESVDVLKNQADSSEVRDALLNAVAHDTNAGVRLKALEGLKPLAGDPIVRRTLAEVLQTDDSPAVRMQVVDLLVQHLDGAMVGVLQGVVQNDDNGYVRLKCERALKGLNASIGTF